jgi:SAM-dependent methyltransferase
MPSKGLLMDDYQLLIDLHKRAKRQGPGGGAETEKAVGLAMIDPSVPLKIADIGCGTGLSTAPLAELAKQTIGLEPSLSMLRWSKLAAPKAKFVNGRVEQLPFLNDSFDLITAAGSLNYADLDQAFPEIARTLQPGGMLTIYDFSQGKSMRGSDRLDRWFAEFIGRYPPAKDAWREITPSSLARDARNLRLRSFQPFEKELPYEIAAYTDYIMTETNVAQAIQDGESEATIKYWCEESLQEVFVCKKESVVFRGYSAYLTPICI